MENLPPRISLEGNRISVFKKKHGKGKDQGDKAGKVIKNWYARIRLDANEYKEVSTREQDLERAKVKAVQLAYKYQARYDQGLAVREDSFKFVAEEYFKDYKKECIKNDRLKYYKEAYSSYEKILLPFFGKRQITGINSRAINQFLTDRSQNGRNRFGKELSNSTLSKEKGYLIAIFDYALKQGFLNKIPDFPKISNKSAFTPRPCMTEKEWIHFNSVLKDFHKELPANALKQRFNRECLRDWCQLIAYSGLRTGEASKLKWKDWEVVNRDGVEYALITVRAEEQGASKTGYRKVVAIKYVNTALKRRLSKSSFTDPDDYIFTEYNSPNPVISFKKSFNAALKKSGIGFKDGKKLKGYTPYGLRHLNASLALIVRNVDIYALALNLGNQMTTTEKFYSKAKPEDFAAQLGKLDFED